MIKYANIKNYNFVGEIAHHLYQWLEEDGSKKMYIIKAYEGITQIFHGRVFSHAKSYNTVKIDKSQLEEIFKILGTDKFEDFDVTNIAILENFKEIKTEE
jgi:hypothetical protein